MLKNALRMCVAVVLALVSGSSAHAEDARALKLNQGTIGLLASQPELLSKAMQIAKAVDHTDGLRVLPIMGHGGIQTISDLQLLRSVDVAMVSSDALAFVKKNGLYTDEDLKISYLAKLANARVIILARPEFTTLASLSGKRIAVGSSDSDEFIAADLIFGDLGFHYEGVGLSGEPALKGMQNRSIDAMVFAGADAYPLLANIGKASGFHILPVSIDAGLSGAYAPAIVTKSDFPNLVPAEATIETVASAVVLAVFDWRSRSERFYKLVRFNSALTTHYFATLSTDNATNFQAAVPGWKAYDMQPATRKQQQSQGLPITALQ